MNYAVGSLVRARGREWIVLPESDEEFLTLRPLGGTEDEIAGIHLSLELVQPAHFELPDPSQVGDHRSCRLLRDAVRLGFRSSAGPFRSFARLGIEPRPYQLVPLLMALKLEPVRLLIADDVGIGKTIEASLIAREFYDRGEIQRIAVLCPPQLAEQWQSELRAKFHIEAELVLPGTATRLERNCRLGQSLFDLYPFVIVSTDFIKSDRRRDEFLRSCPEFVIVDEAHTCSYRGEGQGGRHQRHQLLCGLAGRPDQHLLLVTATPHSGNEQAFRSLLKILKPEFADLPEDLTGKQNELYRRKLAAHFVQRRRADIRSFLKSETPFPDRVSAEETYKLSEDYKRLFTKVLDYAREVVAAPGSSKHRQRVQWWSVLALLRALASSPAAAADTLRTRAATLDTTTAEEADELGKRTVLDLLDDEAAETMDVTPGSIADDDQTPSTGSRERLLRLATEVEKLKGPADVKLQKATRIVETLLRDGYLPIVFCRFVQTAEYVAAALRDSLRGNVDVVAVTGALAPADRELRVDELAKHPKHVLVATDCLSEGINLQQGFNAILHYDLSWNPTRHEQREGRVDRYGQPNTQVRVVTLYGTDNQVDGIVLDVLIRKHKTIRSSLGISVPVPVDTEQVIEAIFEGLLLRQKPGTDSQQLLPGFEEYFRPQKEKLFLQWETSAEREKRSRTMFAQEGPSAHVEEVERELKAARAAIGSSVDVARFTKEAFKIHKALISENGAVSFDLTECPRALRETTGGAARFKARFEQPVPSEVLHLSRTHPVVEGLASFVMDTALDSLQPGMARRCGAIRTGRVSRRTTLLLLRLRFHILSRRGEVEVPLLAEDCGTIAFAGSPQSAEWLDNGTAQELLLAEPDANIHPDQASSFVRAVVESFDTLRQRLELFANERATELLEAHSRVRAAAGLKGIRYRVEPHLPVDVLGIYVYLPKP